MILYIYIFTICGPPHLSKLDHGSGPSFLALGVASHWGSFGRLGLRFLRFFASKLVSAMKILLPSLVAL